jgi:hypothetical protein
MYFLVHGDPSERHIEEVHASRDRCAGVNVSGASPSVAPASPSPVNDAVRSIRGSALYQEGVLTLIRCGSIVGVSRRVGSTDSRGE